MLTFSSRQARENFASCLDEASQNPVRIQRQGRESLILTSEEEFLKTDRAKARFLDFILSQSPDIVNQFHDLVCDLSDAASLTNPEVLKAVEQAEEGLVFSKELP